MEIKNKLLILALSASSLLFSMDNKISRDEILKLSREEFLSRKFYKEEISQLSKEEIHKLILSPLSYACFKGQIADIEILLQQGADPNEEAPPLSFNGDRPLHFAARRQDEKMRKLLIDYGANPTLKNKLGITADELRKSFETEFWSIMKSLEKR
jgi:hypothetical protein